MMLDYAEEQDSRARSELGAALRARRRYLNLTVGMAARMAHISKEQLMNLECSTFDGCNPKLTTILGLTRAYRLEPGFWFEHERRPRM
jgi:transcriptional regulator with XRE-family HTH domain